MIINCLVTLAGLDLLLELDDQVRDTVWRQDRLGKPADDGSCQIFEGLVKVFGVVPVDLFLKFHKSLRIGDQVTRKERKEGRTFVAMMVLKVLEGWQRVSMHLHRGFPPLTRSSWIWRSKSG